MIRYDVMDDSEEAALTREEYAMLGENLERERGVARACDAGDCKYIDGYPHIRSGHRCVGFRAWIYHEADGVLIRLGDCVRHGRWKYQRAHLMAQAKQEEKATRPRRAASPEAIKQIMKRDWRNPGDE